MSTGEEKTVTPITDDRIAAILALTPDLTRDQLEEILYYDWPEGQEHQDWLATAPVSAIANWALVVAQS